MHSRYVLNADAPIQFISSDRRHAKLFVKRLVDILSSLFLIIVLFPILVLIVICLQMTGGNAIFRHPRLGRAGRAFDCLKFRTMVPEADKLLVSILEKDTAALQEWRATRKIRQDPRVTRIGTFLRRTSLDELPQLFNVLHGDMSLVGPRPVTADELREHYVGAAADLYLSVRPGLTGLWQVSGRSNVDYPRRVQLDCNYVNNLSISGDFRLILLTFYALLQRRGAF